MTCYDGFKISHAIQSCHAAITTLCTVHNATERWRVYILVQFSACYRAACQERCHQYMYRANTFTSVQLYPCRNPTIPSPGMNANVGCRERFQEFVIHHRMSISVSSKELGIKSRTDQNENWSRTMLFSPNMKEKSEIQLLHNTIAAAAVVAVVATVVTAATVAAAAAAVPRSSSSSSSNSI